jgi:hypothetical protein
VLAASLALIPLLFTTRYQKGIKASIALSVGIRLKVRSEFDSKTYWPKETNTQPPGRREYLNLRKAESI